MEMLYLLNDSALRQLLSRADKDLQEAEKFKFQRLHQWRKEVVPDFPGVYALYEKVDSNYVLLYIGETGNLRERMSDICRTINHTFRGKLGHHRFQATKIKGKFESAIENLLNNFFDESLYASFLQVNFGRTEIESFLVTKYQAILLNSESKRKLHIESDELNEDQ